MSTITNRNGFSGGYTATVWTLSGLVLAACGGGGSSSGPGVSQPVVQAGRFSVASNGSMMSFTAPTYDTPDSMAMGNYRFVDRPLPDNLTFTRGTNSLVSGFVQGDGALPFAVEQTSTLTSEADWVRLVDTTNPNELWAGKYDIGYDYANDDGGINDPFRHDQLRVKQLYIKLIDGHGLEPTDISGGYLPQNLINKIYMDADVYRNGNTLQGNVKATMLITEAGDNGVQGDISLTLRANTNNNDEIDNGDEPAQTLIVRPSDFDAAAFREGRGVWRDIDREMEGDQPVSVANKNLIGYLMGDALGNNYLRSIGQSNDSGQGPQGALAVVGDTLYADYYMNVPDGWMVRVIWWLDDIFGDTNENGTIEEGETINTAESITATNKHDLPGFDTTLDYSHGVLLANPAMRPTNIDMDNLSAGQAHVGGGMVNDTQNFLGSNDFSVRGNDANQFIPQVAGRYYVQVVAYDPTRTGTIDTTKYPGDTREAADARAQAETALFGFDNLHEIDVLPADFSQQLFNDLY